MDYNNKSKEEIINELIQLQQERVVIEQEIERRRQIEEAYLESEYFFKESQKAANIGSYKTDFIKGYWQSSEVLDEIFGIGKDYVRSIPGWLDIVYNEDSDMMLNYLQEEVIGKRQPFNKEYRIMRISDRQIRWVLGLGKVFFDNDGNVVSLIGTIQDITFRKEAELLLNQKNEEIAAANEEYIQINEELNQINNELQLAKERAEESEETYKMLFESINDAVFISEILENTGIRKFIQVNDVACQKLGYTRDQLLSISPLKINSESSKLIYPAIVQGLLENKQGIYEMEHVTKDGKIIPVEISSRVSKLNNKTIIHSVARDITERKMIEHELILAKEKAEESDRLKTAFLQNMSHEIRTPMNAIMGFSDLLVKNYNNKPKLEKFSKIINQRCNDLLEIINDILDIAKIESGRLTVDFEECNINELFAELLTFFTEYRNRIGKQQIKFNLQSFCEIKGGTIITDKVKLKQIFINLISNSFKFTFEGKIEGGCKLDQNNHLVFFVSDTGVGIPPEKQKLIFNRFTQLNQGPANNIGGTGLGLSIVKGLIELLNGEIYLESQPNSGTTFYFKFPYKTIETNIKHTVQFDQPAVNRLINKTILIVEDDYYNTEYLKEIFSGVESLNILDAADGKSAIELSLSHQVDLILMDIRLPDINGYDVTREIRKYKPNLKIIAQTAYAGTKEKQLSMDAGCNDYISKPANSSDLFSMINRLLS